MKRITLEMTENTPENREKLEAGLSYLVAFKNDNGARKTGNGIWKGPHFSFPALAVWPPMEKVESWCRITDVNLSDLENHAEDGRS